MHELSRRRRRHRVTAAALGLLTAVGLTVVVSAGPAGAAVRPLAAGWTQPNDRRGGDLVFDGFTVRDIARHGLYGMIYHLPTVTDAADCTAVMKNWPKQNIEHFTDTADGIAKRASLREGDEFQPTGVPETLAPQAEKEVSSSETTTSKWEVSMSVEIGFSGLVTSFKSTFGFSYSQEIAVTKGEATTVRNPTNDKLQDYAYGIYRDVYAIQERPWHSTWVNKGGPVFAGDDAAAVARFYTAPVAGCYRVGYFSTLSLPKSKGFGLVSQRRQGSTTTACPITIDTDDAVLYQQVPGANPPKFTDAGAVDRGTCVSLTGKSAGEGTEADRYLQINIAKKTGGRCDIDPVSACDENLWVNGATIAGANDTPAELPKWGDGDTFGLPTTYNKTGKLSTSTKTDDVYLAPTSTSTSNERWQLHATTTPGFWQLRDVDGAKNGNCLTLGFKVLYAIPCEAGDHSNWTFRYATDGQFYLMPEANHSGPKCALTVNEDDDDVAHVGVCKAESPSQLWRPQKLS